MAKRIAGITVELSGDTSQLDKALQRVDKTARSLQTELSTVEKGLQFDPGNSELVRQRQEILAEAIENTAKKLDILKQAQSEVEKKFASGEISTEQYRNFRRELEKTASQLDGLQQKAQSTDAKVTVTADTTSIDKAESKLDGLKKAAKDAAKEIGSALGASSAGVVAGGVGVVAGTNDLNNQLARLRTNAELAGNDLGLVEQAFKDIVAVSGETDSAVETLSNLLAAGISDSDLKGVIDGINGAAIKFSDTLKTEGIADGLQETFATGGAIGQFAELLERSGIDVEDFNAKLAESKKTGDEANLVMDTFAKAGLYEVTEAYKANNDELVKSNQSTTEMQVAMAGLATALLPVITFITDLITKLTEWSAANPEITAALFAMAGVVALITGAIVVLTPIIGALVAAAGILGTTVGALVIPIVAVIAIIGALVAAGIWLYKNWGTIGEKSAALGATIAEAFVKIRRAIVEKITEAAAALVSKFSEMREGAARKLGEMLGKVTSVWGDVLKFLGGIDLYSIGRDIISGMMRGISSMATSLVDTAKGVVNGAIEGAKNLLGIKSPSRVFMEIGKYTGEGMAIGMERSAKLVDDASKVMANASIPDVGHTSNGMPSTDSIPAPRQPIEIPVILSGREIARATVDDISRLQYQNLRIKQLALGSY